MKVDYKDILKAWDEQRPTGRNNGKSFWLAIRYAIQKQIPNKTTVKIQDEDVRIGHVIFAKGTQIHYCPKCKSPVTGSCKFCPTCGQALIW